MARSSTRATTGGAPTDAPPGRGSRRRRVGVAALLGVTALLLGACGGLPVDIDDLGVGTADEGPAEEASGEGSAPTEAAPDPSAEDPGPTEAAGEEATPEEPGEEPVAAPAPDEDAEPQDTGCAVVVDPDGTPMDPDDHLGLVGPINGSMEALVFRMDQDLTLLEEGGSDGPSLDMELAQQLETWEDLVHPVIGLTPPEGAEAWHDRLVASWAAVCAAIVDGREGIAGDDDRFQAYVDALRGFPNLLNELHANAACGPFEAC